jgi:hypothetical protein
MCSANGTCDNQGAWVAKSLTKSEALLSGAHSGNEKKKAPDLQNTKLIYIRGQERPFDAQGTLCSVPGQRPRQGKSPSPQPHSGGATRGPQKST